MGTISTGTGLISGIDTASLIDQLMAIEARPRDLLAPMIGYGKGIVGVNLIAAVVHHADLVVVGRMIGSTALGLYQIAYTTYLACLKGLLLR